MAQESKFTKKSLIYFLLLHGLLDARQIFMFANNKVGF